MTEPSPLARPLKPILILTAWLLLALAVFSTIVAFLVPLAFMFGGVSSNGWLVDFVVSDKMAVLTVILSILPVGASLAAGKRGESRAGARVIFFLSASFSAILGLLLLYSVLVGLLA